MNKILTIIMLLYVPSSAAAVPKKNEPVVKVTVQNTCPGTSEKFLVENEARKDLKKNTTEYRLGPAEGDAYQLIICTSTQCYRYGNMTFLSKHEYNVKISHCNFPGARIESHEVFQSKSSAPPQIRFRSRRVRPVEYRYGHTRFRRLSVGMSRYWPIIWSQDKKGIKIQFRYRIIPEGPVEYTSTHTLLDLKFGHKYFIEVEYMGNQKEIIKIQDEGEIKEKGKKNGKAIKSPRTDKKENPSR